MRRRLALIPVLVAWLLATGSHWDLVQTFAWGKMIATYAQTMPLARAVQLTFTADNLCGICETVSEGKQQGEAALPGAAGVKFLAKIPLVFASNATVLAVVFQAHATVKTTPEIALSYDRAAPPVPPPKV
jgi:hypothetical protein